MARADLASLLGRLPDEPPRQLAEQPHPDTQPELANRDPDRDFVHEVDDGLDQAESGKAGELRARRARRAHHQPAADETVVSAPGPDYLRFVRKDTRLREDQLERLTKESRRLNRAKRNTGVRITDNTLIRVGVDLLLARIDRAGGDDEAAILRSLQG